MLLYELLTGSLPFDPKSLRHAGFGEIQRIIREDEPPKPSTRLSSLGDASATHAQKRRADTRSLTRDLRGDLDWITMKALEKDRTRRYETATGLAADIRRHLNHEPVLAGRPSAGYKLSKFLRRNRTGAIAAAVIAVALLAATIVSIAFARSEGVQRAIAELREQEARDAQALAESREREARIQGEIAEAVNNFLNEDLLAAVAPSPLAGKGKDVLMRDVLDKAASRIEDVAAPGGRFADKRLVEARIRATLGDAYRLLGEYPRAEPHLERARELRRMELGDAHPRTLGSMNDLANLYMDQGRYDEAEPPFLETLQIRRRSLGGEDPRTLISMNNLANLYVNQGRYDEAEPLFVATLEIRERILGEEHPDTLGSRNNLAVLYRARGRYDEAESLFVQMLEIQKRILGEEHPDTLGPMSNLALVYADQGRHDESEPLYVKTLEIRMRILGETHPDTLGSMNNLATFYLGQGRYDEAEPLYLKTVEIKRRVLGEEHPSTLGSITNLGNLYLSMGRFDDARAMFERSLPIKRRVLGMGHPWTQYALQGLARAYRGLDRSAASIALGRELQQYQLAQAEIPDPSAHLLNIAAWDLLTNEHVELRDPPRALTLVERAADMVGRRDPGILNTLALAQHLTGNTAAAVETQKKAMSLLDVNSPDYADMKTTLDRYEAAMSNEAGEDDLAADPPPAAPA